MGLSSPAPRPGAAPARRYAKAGATLAWRAPRELSLGGRRRARAGHRRQSMRATCAMGDGSPARPPISGPLRRADAVIANAGIRAALTDQPGDMPAFRAIPRDQLPGIVTRSRFRRRCDAGAARWSAWQASVVSRAPGSARTAAPSPRRSPYLRAGASNCVGRREVLTLRPGFVATPLTARNPYPDAIPIDADEAARLMPRPSQCRRTFYVFPWPMAMLAPAASCRGRFYDAVIRGAQAARLSATPPRCGRAHALHSPAPSRSHAE